MKYLRILAIGIALGISFAPSSGWSGERSHEGSLFLNLNDHLFCKFILRGELFARTELFFGLNMPGGVVSQEAFQGFIDRQVTPRFPDGLTVVDGKGQFRGASGDLEKEDSKVLILLYPFAKESSQAIEDIRAAYKSAFEQESVLRVDERSCVSF
jgi:uncharacterized protein DUF3574